MSVRQFNCGNSTGPLFRLLRVLSVTLLIGSGSFAVALPASAQTCIWSSTVTAERSSVSGGTVVGYNTHATPGGSSTSTTFTFQGTEYTVTEIHNDADTGEVVFGLSPFADKATTNSWTLQIGSLELRFSAGTRIAFSGPARLYYTWTDTTNFGGSSPFTDGASLFMKIIVSNVEDATNVSIADVSVSESAGSATFTIALNPAICSDMFVNYSTSTGAGDTAIAGADYTASSGAATITANSTSATFTVPILQDNIDENSETFSVTSSIPSQNGATLSDATAIGTITDDDDEPVLVFSVDETLIAEDGGTATITVSTGTGSTFATDQTITLTLAGTATENEDYTLSPDTLTLPAGSGTEASSVTATVTGVDDIFREGDETILISASRSGAAIGAQQTLTITDDDDEPVLVFSVDETSIAENGGTATITVSTGTGSTFATDQTITLTLAGTATENDDYTLSPGTLTLPAGSGAEASSVTATVTGVDDIFREGDETILISASRSGAAIGAQQTLTITDDDDEPVLVFSVDETSIAEDGGAATITVSTGTGSTFATDQTITLTLAGTATENDDYTLSPGTLTLPAGSGAEASSVTATVTGVDDILHEGDETILISASRSGAAIGAQQTLTITDDDDEPVLVFSVDETSIAENGGAATITVSTGTGSTFATDQTITLTLAGTATENDDYTLSPGTLTLPAGSGAEASSVTATVTGVDDILHEGDETILISASRSGAAIGAQQTLTITDDDGPPVLVFSVDETSIAENGGTATITVSTGTGSTFATDQTITLTLAGTATENEDYTLSPDTLTLPAGSGTEASSVTATVTGVDDILREGDETILISASRSGAAIGAQQTLTITDDDDEPVLVFSVDETSIAENGGTATITVSTGTGSTFATDQTITLTLAGTATENEDYTLSPDTLTLPAGSGAEASSVTATVTGVDDIFREGDETILISASRSGAAIGAQQTLTITDDDDEPVLVFSVDETSIAENGGTATITVSTGTGSTFATDQTITLTLAGTATENDDYTLSPDTLTLPAGSGAEASSVTATVTGVDDIFREGDETILISASRSGAAIGAQQTLTITDDDDEPVLVFSVDETSIAENGGTATITVSTGTGSTFATDQTITLTLAGTATENEDYTLSPDTLTLPAGSGTEASSVTATVTGVDDIFREGDETILISASRSGAAIGAQQTLTITDDDDEPVLVFSVDETSIAENGGTATITVSTGTGSTFATDQTITLTLAGTATENDDYTLSPGTLTLPAGSGAEASSVTATVTGVDDIFREGDETILISASRSGAAIGAQQTLTITDDDDEPVLVFSVDETSIAENGGTATITVSTGTGSTFATDQTITLTLAGTATENEDYTLSPDTLTLPAGSGAEASSVTATVTGVDDILREGDETILISASRSGAAIGAQQTLTITDDDGPPVLVFSVDETSIAENGGTATITVSTGTGSTFATDQTITLTLAGTATENDDYTLSPDTLTLPAGSGAEASSVTATVTGVDDIFREGDETILISASRSGAAIGAQQTLTITDDDDEPVLVFSVDETSIAENGGTATITVSTGTGSTFATDQTITLTLAGTATENEDYTLSPDTLTLPAGSGTEASSVTATVTGVDDIFREGDETILISASRSGAAIGAQQTLTITDDDDEPVLVFSVDETSIAENGGTATITVSTGTGSTFATDQTITLTLAGTATENDDYTLSPGTLTLPAGSGAEASSVTATVTGVDDIFREGDETILISASRSGAAIGAQQTLTITDDDEPPPPVPAVVTLVLTPDTIDENGGASAVTATVSPASEEPFRVTVSAVADAPAAAGDFELSGTVLSFAANATDSTGEVTVTAFDNDQDAPDKTVTVSGTVSLTGVVEPSHVTLTITDDDEPPPPVPAVVTLVLTPDTIAENRGESAVTATVSPASEEPFNVTVSAIADAPAAVGDFELSGTVLSFAANATDSTGEVTVTAFDNDQDAPDKTVTVSGTVSLTSVVEPSHVTLTITDDDEPPPPVPAVVTLVLTPDTIDENGGASAVTATVSPASEEPFRVTVSAVADAPAAAGDFELSGTVLSFAANATDSTGEVTVTAFDNDQDAPDKTVTVSGTVSLTGVVEPSHVTLTITDDDEPPPPVPAVVTLVLTPDTIAENRGESAVTATVSPASEEPFRVTVSAVADAPAAAGDFELSGTVLSFAANATDSTGEVTVTAFDNDQDAPDKTVTVSGTVSLTGVVEPSHVTLTITDDDEPPPPVPAVVTLVLTPDTIAENRGASAVTATVSPASEESFSVTVSAVADAPAVAGDFELSGTVLSFAANTTDSTGEVTVTAFDNDQDAPDKTVTVSGTVSLTGVVEPSHVTLTITDDDEPPPPVPAVVTLVLTPDTIDENGGASAVTATVSPASEEPFRVTVSAVADAPAAAGDFELSGTVLSFAANATDSTGEVTVTAFDNDQDAPDKTVTVSGTVSLTGVVEPSHVTLTITDDDEPPPPVPAVVTLVLTPDTIAENRGESAVTATVSPASEEPFRVTVSAVADAPAAAGDFELSGTVLSFAANATDSTGEVTVTAFDNDQDAPDKTVTVSGTVSLTGVVEPSHVTLTITDDDEPPPPVPAVVTLVLTPDTIAENRGASAVTATVSPASEESFSVTVSAVADAPAVAGDFELSGTVLSFAANATDSTGEVTVTAFDNDQDAPDKTVTVSGTVSLTGVVEPSHVTLTITDDDEPPPPVPAVVTLVLTPDTIDENGGASAVTATVSPASEEPFRVTVSAVADAPAAAGDFELSGTVLSFAANATDSTGEVTVTAFDNDQDAPDKTVTVSGTVSLTGVVEPSHVTLTITDDDEPPPPVPAVVTLVLTPDTIDENGGASAVTATVSPASEEPFNVTVSAIADAPAAVGDFELSGTVLSFAANATDSTGEVTVTAFDNDQDAPDKTVTVSGTVSLTSVVEPSHVTLTITDDDTRGVEITPTELTVPEADPGGGLYTVALTSQPFEEVKVLVSGYTDNILDVSPVTLTFTVSNWRTAQKVRVTAALDDDTDDQVFVLTHEATGGGYDDVPLPFVAVTVTDTVSPRPDLAVADASGAESDGKLVFEISLIGHSSQAVTVDYTTRDGTAQAGADYRSSAGTVAIPAGQTRAEIVVPLLLDLLNEAEEFFTLELSNPVGVQLVDAQAVGLIRGGGDEDTASRHWLARLGRITGDHIVKAVEEQFEAYRRNGRAPGGEITIAGHRLLSEGLFVFESGEQDHLRRKPAAWPSEFGRGPSNAVESKGARWNTGAGGTHFGATDTALPGLSPRGIRELALGDLFSGSGFRLAASGSGKGVISIWGRGAYSRFESAAGRSTAHGDALTAIVGADYDCERCLLGITISRTWADEGYGAPGQDSGSLDSSTTGLHPYMGYQLSERVWVWGLAGYSTGDMVATPALGGDSVRIDLRTRLAAVGARGELLSGSDKFSLAIKTDAMVARTRSGNAENVLEAEGKAQRIRLGLQGSHLTEFGPDSSLRSRVELALRSDSGDAEKGFGLEVGGGLDLIDLIPGLTMNLVASGLVSHESDGFEEWGVSGGFRYDPSSATAKGLLLSLTQSWGGQVHEGVQSALWTRNTARRNITTPGLEHQETNIELAYGLETAAGAWIPWARIGINGPNEHYRVGHTLMTRYGGLSLESGMSMNSRDYRLAWETNIGCLAHVAVEIVNSKRG